MQAVRVYIWDWSTRLFHWGLVVAVSVALGTGLSGNLDAMDWHMVAGYAVIGLLLFRLLTGLLNRDYGHFSRFPLGPRRVLGYLRGREQFAGHNPLGSWMVVLLLLSLATQSISGLMTSDGIFLEGPWVLSVSDETSSWAGRIHKINYYILGGLAALHILAVLGYWLIQRTNLIIPMFTGYKTGLDAAPAQSLGWLRLVILAGIAAGLTWALISLP